MDYEWDKAKGETNLVKHNVEFSHVQGFVWETAQLRQDTRYSYGEDRFIALGRIDDRTYVLVFTVRYERCRVVSLRKANKRESKKWKETQSEH